MKYFIATFIIHPFKVKQRARKSSAIYFYIYIVGKIKRIVILPLLELAIRFRIDSEQILTVMFYTQGKVKSDS